MPIDLTCRGCGRRLRVSDDAAGKQARCPACSQVNAVPPANAPPSQVNWPASLGGDNPFQKGHPVKPAAANPYQPPQAPAPWPVSYGQRANLASRGTRFAGAILDGLITLAAAIPGFVLFLVGADRNEPIAVVGMLAIGAGILVVTIINWVMISQRGQSIAKRMLGMRIVGYRDGLLPGFVRGVILRVWLPALIAQACSLFSLIDVLFIFGEEKRCLHDLLADTTVVNVGQENWGTAAGGSPFGY